MLDLAATNLLSPAVLCFALGAAAVFLRSDLRLPEPVFAALSIYLMLAIGMKGGVELSERPLGELAAPMAAGLLLGCLIPLGCFALLRRFAGLSIPDAAAMAAHYGSVSAVTFAAVTAFLDAQQVPYEGHVAALLAVMEIPAIAVAIALAQMPMLVSTSYVGGSGGAALSLRQGSGPSEGLAGVISNAMASKSVVLLGGGLAIGVLIGPTGMTKVKPLFVDLFPGLLCLFLLELGRLAASRIGDFRQVGLKLAVFAIAMPVVHAMLGITLGEAIGLSMGGAVVLGTLAASSSYIAAPAAVRLALPEANPSYYLTCSLALTFPFNIVVGLPLYSAFAGWLYA